MDSSKTTITTATTTISAATTVSLSDSPPVQESPFSNYVSRLSPIKPVKASHVAQGLLGINSPPLVFTSPRTLSDRQTNFLRRFQCPQISGAEISKNDGGSKKSADGPEDLRKSSTYLNSRLIVDVQKSNNINNNSEQDQPGSFSGCVDEYLSDPVDVDCAYSVNLVSQDVKRSDDAHQSSESNLTKSKIAILESDGIIDMETKGDASQAMPEQDGKDPKEQSTSETKKEKIEEEGNIVEQPSHVCPNFVSDLVVDHASRQQQYNTSGAQAAPPYEDYGEDGETVLHGPVQLITHHGSEVSQLHRGMSRRCLQFEEAQQKTPMDGTYSLDSAITIIGSISSSSNTELEILDSSQVELPSSSSKKQTMFVSKPSGFGLHLNSIVNTLPIGCSASEPIMSHHSAGYKISCSKLPNLVERVSSTAGDDVLQTKASLATGSAISESLHTKETLNKLQPPEHQITLHNNRRFSSEHADNFEEFNQSSPKKKRKKVSSTDGDGCKRCNCKKTRCLKRYCDCFAAGIYCAETCACQGCFNRPEYEDTVLEARQQKESHNPLAFAPKIVQHVTEFHAINVEDAGLFTPSSGRHKTGCNCKRSMCVKKYCECYQANVGCSNACRCEGCKNIHGRKEEYGMTGEIVSNRANEERLESMADNKFKMIANNKFLQAELYDPRSLTPPTPSFECSSHGKEAAKSRLLPGRYVLSSEPDFSMLPSYAKSISSPSNSHGNDMLRKTSKTLDVVSHSQELDYNITETMGQFSPRFDELADFSDHTPLPNPSPIIMASSSSKMRDTAIVSQLCLYPGSGRLSSGGSLQWRSSPITPMTRLGETKTQALDSGCGLYDILEDDTPEIFKESPTPVTSVKASSPHKKRVSPPRGHFQEFQSSSSASLKSGRKFVLKSVPSFPPLTPCIDPKDRTQQKY
ncbi:CRC domain-containing protein TSO1-like isoform X1 [Populus alba x Populus x berolinensis]|nr:CRC domain-containing protein TSO1-like isoform X1 [Populus alba x Populus x berolinensis]